MSISTFLSSPAVRRNVLRLLVVVVLFQVVFNYFLPSSYSSSLTSPAFEDKIKQGQDAGGQPQHIDTAVTEDKYHGTAEETVPRIKDKPMQEEEKEEPKSDNKRTAFFTDTMKMFMKNKPENIPDIELNGKAPSYFYIDIPNPTFTIEFLSQFLKISDAQVDELQRKHDSLKKDILKLDYPTDTFHGKGIVMIGGGSFMGTALTSIRALRETGSELPLELMLTSHDEYDADVCEKLLPKLNGKCLIMEEIIGKEIFTALNLQKYELKVLGLFLSSFEEVLLLDADNIAIKSPDYILESQPYKETGYIIWPDFWRQTISPYFYKIAGVEIGEPVRKDGVPPDEPSRPRKDSQLSDLEGAIPDSTCEAGQLAINKKLHHRSLLATVYYNLNGFKYYYWLLGQGAVGVGDKDTFIAGLTVFKEPFYFVKTRPLLYGYDHEGGWQDTTMIQFDPEQDFEYYSAAKRFLISEGIDSRVNLGLNHGYVGDLKSKIHENINKTLPEVQFLHVHAPKFNAKKNLENNDYETDGHDRRQFGTREKIKDALPLDWELKASRISQWLACESEIIPKDWKDIPREKICDRIKKHVEWLIETSDSPEMANLKDIGV